MTKDTRDIENRLRKWIALYFAEAGPEEPMMVEFLRDVQLAADALSTTHAENAALAAQLADAVSTIREIAEVGSGYGGRKAEVEKFSYSTTTGEGHQECRDLADAFLTQLDGGADGG